MMEGVQRYFDVDGRTFRFIRQHRDTSVELAKKTLDHLETETRPGFIDVEVFQKPDALIRYFLA